MKVYKNRANCLCHFFYFFCIPSILQVDFDFASWMKVLLRCTFWTSTLALIIRFEPFVKYLFMFGIYNDWKSYYQAAEQ